MENSDTYTDNLDESSGLQSAIEWVQERIIKIHDDLDQECEIIEAKDALDLARRCDETERERDLCKLTLERMPSDADYKDIRAQLAAAQAEAGRLRGAIHKLERMADERSHRVAPMQLVMMFEEIEDAARAALAKEGGE